MAMRRLLIVSAAAAQASVACSLLTSLDGLNAPKPTAGDAGGDAAVGDGSNEAGPRCDPTQPFGARREVKELGMPSGASEARLSPDELTVYFGGDGGLLYRATRTSTAGPFSAPVALNELAIPTGADSPSPTMDGLTLYFHTSLATNDGGACLAFDAIPVLEVANRANVNAMFGSPTMLNFPSMYYYFQPYVLPDASALYFSYGDPMSCKVGFARAELSQGEVVNVVPLAEFASTVSTSEIAPVATPDELAVYYGHREVSATDPMGLGRIAVARRASKAQPFSGLHQLPELVPADAAEWMYPTWVSADECHIYFDVVGADGVVRIYTAERPG